MMTTTNSTTVADGAAVAVVVPVVVPVPVPVVSLQLPTVAVLVVVDLTFPNPSMTLMQNDYEAMASFLVGFAVVWIVGVNVEAILCVTW